MSIVQPTHSSLEKYLMGPGKFPSTWNGFAEITDRIFEIGEHSAGIGATILNLRGKSDSAETCGNFSHAFGIARAPIGAVRFVEPWHKLFTGAMFWQQAGDGSFRRVEQENGKAKKLSREELLRNYEYDEAEGVYKEKNSVLNRTSTDGKYIDRNLNGTHVTRDWMSIVMDILILAARTLTPIKWLHALKAYDLGKHARGVGGAIIGLWCCVLSMDLVSNIRSASEAPTMKTMRKSLVDGFCDALDLISLPFDCGVGMNVHPALTVIGSALCIFSSASYLAKEYYYY